MFSYIFLSQQLSYSPQKGLQNSSRLVVPLLSLNQRMYPFPLIGTSQHQPKFLPFSPRWRCPPLSISGIFSSQILPSSNFCWTLCLLLLPTVLPATKLSRCLIPQANNTEGYFICNLVFIFCLDPNSLIEQEVIYCVGFCSLCDPLLYIARCVSPMPPWYVFVPSPQCIIEREFYLVRPMHDSVNKSDHPNPAWRTSLDTGNISKMFFTQPVSHQHYLFLCQKINKKLKG